MCLWFCNKTGKTSNRKKYKCNNPCIDRSIYKSIYICLHIYLYISVYIKVQIRIVLLDVLCKSLNICYGVYLHFFGTAHLLPLHICANSLFLACMSLNLLFLRRIVWDVGLVLNEVWYLTLAVPPTCLTESFLVTFAHKRATSSCYCQQK